MAFAPPGGFIATNTFRDGLGRFGHSFAGPGLRLRQGGKPQSAGANMAGDLNAVMRNGGGKPPKGNGMNTPSLRTIMGQ